MTTARVYPDTRCPFCHEMVRVTKWNAFYAHKPVSPTVPLRVGTGRCFGSGAYAYARKVVR